MSKKEERERRGYQRRKKEMKVSEKEERGCQRWKIEEGVGEGREREKYVRFSRL